MDTYILDDWISTIYFDGDIVEPKQNCSLTSNARGRIEHKKYNDTISLPLRNVDYYVSCWQLIMEYDRSELFFFGCLGKKLQHT